ATSDTFSKAAFARNAGSQDRSPPRSWRTRLRHVARADAGRGLSRPLRRGTSGPDLLVAQLRLLHQPLLLQEVLHLGLQSPGRRPLLAHDHLARRRPVKRLTE